MYWCQYCVPSKGLLCTSASDLVISQCAQCSQCGDSAGQQAGHQGQWDELSWPANHLQTTWPVTAQWQSSGQPHHTLYSVQATTDQYSHHSRLKHTLGTLANESKAGRTGQTTPRTGARGSRCWLTMSWRWWAVRPHTDLSRVSCQWRPGQACQCHYFLIQCDTAQEQGTQVFRCHLYTTNITWKEDFKVSVWIRLNFITFI